jgi:hypothetical protein
MIVEYLLGRIITMKTRRSIQDAAPLGLTRVTGGDQSSSGATLALLDVEAGGATAAGDHVTISNRRNGYLSVPTPSESDRSRSTSPLYIGHNGFIFPSPGSTTLASKVLASSMMRFVSKTGEFGFLSSFGLFVCSKTEMEMN